MCLKGRERNSEVQCIEKRRQSVPLKRWSIQYCSGARARLPDSPSICSGRSSCKWCPTVSPPLCTTLCSTCEGSWELLFYYLPQTRHSRGCFRPRTSAPRLHAPTVSKITSKCKWRISTHTSLSLSIVLSSLSNHGRAILLSQTYQNLFNLLSSTNRNSTSIKYSRIFSHLIF